MSLRLTVLALILFSSVVLAAEPKPPPFITPYPGQKLYGDAFQVTDFDEHHFIVAKTTGQPPPGQEFKRVEGKITQFVYEHPSGRSSLEVFKNYEEGLKKAGFETVYTCAGKACGSTVAPFPGWLPQLKQWVPDEKNRYLLAKLTRPTEGNIWVGFYINLVGLEVNGINIVEERPMQTGMVAVDAAALKKGLEDHGYIAVYGIVFDTGKATLKAESAKALEQVKKLLEESPALKLYVVGHTDDVGSESANVALSNARASAVVKELVGRYQVKKDRLKAAGVGPYVPVATNRNEQGRAKNRRVVLVEDVP